MNSAEWLAVNLRERDNPIPFAPVEGIVAELPELKIRINQKVVLTAEDIRSIVNLYDTDSNNNYIWLGRRVYLLPFYLADSIAVRKYLVIGGDAV